MTSALPSGFEMRFATLADIPLLAIFFKQAYGPDTVFQNFDFLKWYFFTQYGCNGMAAGSIICLDTTQSRVVSFYGSLPSELYWFGKTTNIAWGVSAFTLPEYRGLGLNGNILKKLAQSSSVHGVIGFTPKTAGFYQLHGYHLFGLNRFTRYIFTVSEAEVKAIVQFLNPEAKSSPIEQNAAKLLEAGEGNIIALTSANLTQLGINFPYQVAVTTRRDKTHILNRFINHPFIRYEVFGYVQNQEIVAYTACRIEQLEPLPYSCCRIIDLFGQSEAVAALAGFVAARTQKQGLTYVDFSAFGDLYKNELTQAGFAVYENENFGILPQVTAPVIQRPNLEYIGLYSTAFADKLPGLTEQNVYFTRMDSDRDRLARITQVQTPKLVG